MDWVLERVAQTLRLEGQVIRSIDLPALRSDLELRLGHASATEASELNFKLELVTFLQDWFDESEMLTVKTSGSTGTPKLMRVSKERMMRSAQLTLEFLQLAPNDAALLCMPLDYIAGKMMVVRALVGGLDLYPVAPCGHPLQHCERHVAFAAMIPLQVFNSLQDEVETQRLRSIEQLIIGGGSIDAALERALYDFPHQVWSTYGMTETLSHIALRRINGPEASLFYQPFAQVQLSLSPENTLVIDAPLVAEQQLVTNDIVVFNEQGQFRIKGRKDNVINSGGIKLQIEELEAKIKALAPSWDFQISAQEHPKFGQVVVLLITRSSLPATAVVTSYLEQVLQDLPRFERPKRYVVLEALPRTGTNKPDRASARRLAQAASSELFAH